MVFAKTLSPSPFAWTATFPIISQDLLKAPGHCRITQRRDNLKAHLSISTNGVQSSKTAKNMQKVETAKMQSLHQGPSTGTPTDAVSFEGKTSWSMGPSGHTIENGEDNDHIAESNGTGKQPCSRNGRVMLVMCTTTYHQPGPQWLHG